MIKPLRKRHLQIWLMLAILLPAGIVFGWLVIPGYQPVKLLHPPQAELLPVLVKSADKKNYWVNLRSNDDRSQWQLEWVNKYELTVPSAVIYRKTENDSSRGNELIGRIEARGRYVFPLKFHPEEEVFLLYDFIHEKMIDSIIFKISRQPAGPEEL